jgi:PST family polysaccharide transporter
MFKKIGQSSVGVFITYVFKTVLLIVYARLLSPVDYGVFAATMVVVNLAERFTDLGFGPALVQRKEISEIHVNTAFTTSVFLGLSLTCLTFFGAGFISRTTGVPATYQPIRAMSIIFLIRSIYSSAYALLQRDLDFNFIVKIDIFSYIIASGVIGLIIALSGGGVWALVIAEVSEAAIACGMALYKKKTRYKFRISKPAFNDLFKFGFGQIFYQLVLYFVQQSDNFIVGRYMGAKNLGIYSRAYALLVLPSRLFGLAAGRVIFPSMAKFQHDIDRFGEFF